MMVRKIVDGDVVVMVWDRRVERLKIGDVEQFEDLRGRVRLQVMIMLNVEVGVILSNGKDVKEWIMIVDNIVCCMLSL